MDCPFQDAGDELAEVIEGTREIGTMVMAAADYRGATRRLPDCPGPKLVARLEAAAAMAKAIRMYSRSQPEPIMAALAAWEAAK